MARGSGERSGWSVRRIGSVVLVATVAGIVGAGFLAVRWSADDPADRGAPRTAAQETGSDGAMDDSGPAVAPAGPASETTAAPAPVPTAGTAPPTGQPGEARPTDRPVSAGTPHETPTPAPVPSGVEVDAPVQPEQPAPPPDSVPPSDPPAATLPAALPGTVQSCNTYGEDCGPVPLYGTVPPDGYDYHSFPAEARVPDGTVLDALCWARGAMVYNYAAFFDPPDLGPNPYASDLWYRVSWSGHHLWIADVYFVRDVGGYGLPAC
jgi:hypothetical protein